MAIAIAAIFCLNDLFGYPLRFVAPVSVLLVFSGLTVISWGPESKRKMVWGVCVCAALFLFLELTDRFSQH
jgi:hypothetical protein